MSKMLSACPGVASLSYACPQVEIPEPLWRAPTDRLLHRLDSLCGRQSNPHTRKAYDEVRRSFWALNMVLNNNGDIAPRFRPVIPVGKPPLSDEEKVLTNDKQVLDLHWLSVQEGRSGRSLPNMAARWKHMFENDLDLTAAAIFVRTVGSTENKVLDLILSPAEQLKLQVIQSDAIRKYWQRMRAKREGLHAALVREAIRNRQLRGNEAVWTDAWLAGELAQYAGGASGPEWYRLMTGQEIAPSRLSQIRKRLEKNANLKAAIGL